MTCSTTRARDHQYEALSKRRAGRTEHEQFAGDVDVEQKPTKKHHHLTIRRNHGRDRQRRKLLVFGRRRRGQVEISDEFRRQ